jgi:hypothetical protein
MERPELRCGHFLTSFNFERKGDITEIYLKYFAVRRYRLEIASTAVGS